MQAHSQRKQNLMEIAHMLHKSYSRIGFQDVATAAPITPTAALTAAAALHPAEASHQIKVAAVCGPGLEPTRHFDVSDKRSEDHLAWAG